MRSLQKIPMGLHGTNFFTSLTRFRLSVVTQPNSPKCTQIVRNAQKHEFRVQWVDHVLSLPKILMRVRGTNFCINCNSSAYFAPSSCSNETIQNAPKHYKMHQFMSLVSNGVDRLRSLRKTLMRFRGTNFFIYCTSSTHFAPSSV